MANELKACPMCGAEASPNGVIRRSSSPDLRWEDGSECLEAFYCNCMSCGMNNAGMAGGYQTREQAVAHWNHRAPAPAFVAMREALRGTVGGMAMIEGAAENRDYYSIGSLVRAIEQRIDAALVLADAETK